MISMTSLFNRAAAALMMAGLAAAAAPPACDPDNGGIQLPTGFCALVVADNIGTARHLAVAANGDIYVAIMGSRNHPGGVVALHDRQWRRAI